VRNPRAHAGVLRERGLADACQREQFLERALPVGQALQDQQPQGVAEGLAALRLEAAEINDPRRNRLHEFLTSLQTPKLYA
jgi:hypothetical protein